MRLAKYIFTGILVLFFFTNIYVYRSDLFSEFDEKYWRVKYEQSQWLLPLSWRIIGDDGLYLYEGYKIIHGFDPTLVNAEVPPLPKYLIGLSILLTGNGHWYGVAFTAGSVLIFYYLSKRLLENKTLALGITLLFALDPLLVEQFPLTMIDSAQLFFLLLYFLLLMHIPANGKKYGMLSVAAAGVVLGLFSNTRFPVLTPILMILGGISIYKNFHSVIALILFTGAVFISYLIPYVWYFALGHSFMDWLGVQKWIISFYRSSRLDPNFGSIWTTLLLNKYRNLFTGSFEGVTQWSVTWAAVTITAIVTYIRIFLKKTSSAYVFRAVGVFLFITLIFYSFIPFWTRYLLIILPFLYLGLGFFLKPKKPKFTFIILGFLVVFNIFPALRILLPTPESTVRQFVYAFEHGFFHDMYENFDAKSKSQTTRDEFHTKGLSHLRNGEIEVIQIPPPEIDWYRFISPQYIPLKVRYYTRNLGSFSETITIPVTKENGHWRINWNWEIFLPGLPEDGKLETIVEPARRGSIIFGDRNNDIKDFPNYMVWVNPSLVDKEKENEMLLKLSEVFANRIPAVYVHHRYVFNNDPEYPVPIGVPPVQIDETSRSILLSYPGVSLTPAFGRKNIFYEEERPGGNVQNGQYIECCSRLYTTTTYDGISGSEKEHNDTLKGINGGSLTIVNKDGKAVRVLIEAEKRDGKDVRL